MNVMIIIGIAIAFFLLIGLGMFFWIKWKSRGNKVQFVLHSRDMRSSQLIDARVKINEKGIQQYFFSKYHTRLNLRPPTRYLNNKPVRDITFDRKGDLTYIDSFRMDEELNIDIVLSHEEKIVTLNRLEENQNKYNSSINKFQAMAIIGIVIMMVISVLGAGYMGYNLYQTSKVVNENSEETSKIASIHQNTASQIKLISEQLTSTTALLVNGGNVTRQIS